LGELAPHPSTAINQQPIAMGIARDDKPMRQDWVLRGFRQFDAPVSLVRQNGPTSVSVRLADFAHSDHPRYSAANAMDFRRLADTFATWHVSHSTFRMGSPYQRMGLRREF
jgi:hypothetical protein